MSHPIRLESTLDPALLRAARAMLGWGLVEASRHAGVSIASVLAAEGRGRRPAAPSPLDSLRRAYEEAGVTCFDDAAAGRGVRFAPR